MAKFCTGCGAPLEDGSRFCGACGKLQEETPAEEPMNWQPADQEESASSAVPEGETATPWSAPQEEPETAQQAPWDAVQQEEPEASQQAPWDAVQQEEPEASQQAPWDAVQQEENTLPWNDSSAPAVRKPLPKWVIPVAAVVVVLVASVAVLRNFNTPERAMDKFLKALEEGNTESLAKMTVAADEELVLTPELLQPLVRMYQDDPTFQNELADRLESEVERMEDELEPQEDEMYSMRGDKNPVFTTYKIVLETCDTVNLSADLLGDVTVEGGYTVKMKAEDGSDDVYQTCYGTLEDLLPGKYAVTGTVETDYGVTLTGETDLIVYSVDQAQSILYYDYTTVEVYNDSNVPIEILANGQTEPMVTLDPGITSVLGPFQEDTPLQARAVAPLVEQPMTMDFDGSVGYQEVWFSLSTLEIYNYYNFPMQVYRDGEVLAEVAGYDAMELVGLPVDTELSIQAGDEGLLEPFSYVVEDESYDAVYPELMVSSATEETLRQTLQERMQELVNLYVSGDLAGLQAMEENGEDDATYWRSLLEDRQEREADGEYYFYYRNFDFANAEVADWEVRILEDPIDDADENSIVVYVRMHIETSSEVVYVEPNSEGSVEQTNWDISQDSYLQYQDGQWTFLKN